MRGLAFQLGRLYEALRLMLELEPPRGDEARGNLGGAIPASFEGELTALMGHAGLVRERLERLPVPQPPTRYVWPCGCEYLRVGGGRHDRWCTSRAYAYGPAGEPTCQRGKVEPSVKDFIPDAGRP